MLPLSLQSRTRSDAVALVAGGERCLSFRDLSRMLSELQWLFERPEKALIAVFVDRDFDAVLAYLASLSCGHACGLFGVLPGPAQELFIENYRPEFVVGADADGEVRAQRWGCRRRIGSAARHVGVNRQPDGGALVAGEP
jgi:hypothetical protein